MGLFDTLAQQAGSLLAGKLGEGNPDLLNAVESLMRQHGGLAGLLAKFNEAGLGSQVASWIGTGENQPVSAGNIVSALGKDQVAAVAQRMGVDPQQAAGSLAQWLPTIVDRLTPKGSVPDNSAIDAALGALKGRLGG